MLFDMNIVNELSHLNIHHLHWSSVSDCYNNSDMLPGSFHNVDQNHRDLDLNTDWNRLEYSAVNDWCDKM